AVTIHVILNAFMFRLIKFFSTHLGCFKEQCDVATREWVKIDYLLLTISSNIEFECCFLAVTLNRFKFCQQLTCFTVSNFQYCNISCKLYKCIRMFQFITLYMEFEPLFLVIFLDFLK